MKPWTTMDVMMDSNFYDITDNDLKELWNSEGFGEPSDMLSGEWLLDASPILFQDRMMSDTVTGEHSYSSAQQEVHTILPDIKMEEEDMDSEMFAAVPVSTATGQQDLAQIKEGVASPPQSPIVSPVGRIISASSVKRKFQTSSASLSAAPGSSLLRVPQSSLSSNTALTIEPVRVKVEAGLNCLPLSPPSSVSNDSESDGSVSPVHPSQLSCPVPTSNPAPSPKCRKIGGASAQLTSQLISSQGNSRSGVLFLTDEEKRTLIAEGYPVPTKLPLSRAEERSLKKIRRKIKNKISAQESRRKKKEYMDALEKKVENLTAEQRDMKIRYEQLLRTNEALVEQLRLLQARLDGGVPVEENIDEIINITDVAEDASP